MVSVVVVFVATGLLRYSRGKATLVEALAWPRSPAFRTAVGGQYRPLVLRGRWWRLATGVMLHGDPLHLTVNAVALWSLGRLLEPWIGPLRLVSWFVLGGLGGALLTHLVAIPQSDGASGGAFALLGALVVLGWRWRPRFDDVDKTLMGPVLLGFLVVNLILSFLLPFINAAGHLGGLAVGLALGATWNGPTKHGWILHAVVVGGFAVTCLYGWERIVVH